jgi:hypothetical protein
MIKASNLSLVARSLIDCPPDEARSRLVSEMRLNARMFSIAILQLDSSTGRSENAETATLKSCNRFRNIIASRNSCFISTYHYAHLECIYCRS